MTFNDLMSFSSEITFFQHQGTIAVKFRIASPKRLIHTAWSGSPNPLSDFGGLGVACWPLVPKFAGSNPAKQVLPFAARISSVVVTWSLLAVNIEHSWVMYNKPVGCSTPAFGAPHNNNNSNNNPLSGDRSYLDRQFSPTFD
jgi:hypothetical protein